MKSEAMAIVNTVNTVGVMGKGIALQFKETFPKNHQIYVETCKKKELRLGKLLAIWDEHFQIGKNLSSTFLLKFIGVILQNIKALI